MKTINSIKLVVLVGGMIFFLPNCTNNVKRNEVKIDSLKTEISRNEDINDAIFASNVNIIYEPSGRIQAIYEPNLGYRELNRIEIPNINNFIGLFYKDGLYYLKPEKISFADSYSECTGDSTLSLVSEARFLFLNFIDYNKNQIQSILSEGKEMLPNEKFTFDFGNKQYELEAFGEKGINEYNVIKYSLVYSIKGMTGKQTIVNIPKIEETSVQLLFIGDLDGDGNPDIILNAPSNYENRIIMVFLSSTAKRGDYLRCEAQKSDWFDC